MLGGVKILLTEWGPFGPSLESINKNVGFDSLNSWWNYIYLSKYCYWKYLGLLESNVSISFLFYLCVSLNVIYL